MIAFQKSIRDHYDKWLCTSPGHFNLQLCWFYIPHFTFTDWDLSKTGLPHIWRTELGSGSGLLLLAHKGIILVLNRQSGSYPYANLYRYSNLLVSNNRIILKLNYAYHILNSPNTHTYKLCLFLKWISVLHRIDFSVSCLHGYAVVSICKLIVSHAFHDWFWH